MRQSYITVSLLEPLDTSDSRVFLQPQPSLTGQSYTYKAPMPRQGTDGGILAHQKPKGTLYQTDTIMPCYDSKVLAAIYLSEVSASTEFLEFTEFLGKSRIYTDFPPRKYGAKL